MENAIIAQIRAEIERLLTKWESADAMAEDLLSFLSDLEKSEKLTSDEGLDKDVESWYFNEISPKINVQHTNYHYFKECAHRYYDLGCRRTAEKYDEIEYNRQRAEGRVLPGFEDEPKGIPGKDFVPVEWVETLEMYGKWKIVKLEEDGSSEIPNDLEEAAEKQIDEALFKWSYDDEDGIEQYVHDAFIAGAKWDREQMMKDAVEADVNIYRDLTAGESWAEFVVEMSTNNLGDKVRIIVLPKEG